METAVIQTSNFNQTNFSVRDDVTVEIETVSPVFDAGQSAFELGLWLVSLESFLGIGNQAFAEETRLKAARDWTKEFRLTHSSLVICSKLTVRLGKDLRGQNNFVQLGADVEISKNSSLRSGKFEISVDEIYKISNVLRNALLLNEALLRGSPLRFGEWKAWSQWLAEELKSIGAFDILAEIVEAESIGFLPEIFQNLIGNQSLDVSLETDLKLILPRFAEILKALGIVEQMLENDEPLKPSLLIFSRIYEQINELIKYIDNRLSRFPDEEGELFGTLDGTAYTASIELRKVYNHELVGLAELRQTPVIYARIETAYSLLNDSFQQTLVNFARLIKPEITGEEIFPNFGAKLKQSLLLRRNLWEILQSVKAVEQNSEKTAIDSLDAQLNDFLASTLHFLFYKDTETVERFIEEVLITDNKKDLVPVLHRFGAYLETLFGQINMRAVLAEHPFDK